MRPRGHSTSWTNRRDRRSYKSKKFVKELNAAMKNNFLKEKIHYLSKE
jgi:hypothetical protein